MADVKDDTSRTTIKFIYLLLLINYSAYFFCQVVAEDLGVVKKVNSLPISFHQKYFFFPWFLGAPVRYFFLRYKISAAKGIMRALFFSLNVIGAFCLTAIVDSFFVCSISGLVCEAGCSVTNSFFL